MARTKQTARKSTVGHGPRGHWLEAEQQREQERQEMNTRFTSTAVESLEDALGALQGTLAPRAHSPGTSPFLLALSPWLEWDSNIPEWKLSRELGEDLDVNSVEWKPLAQTVMGIFKKFRDPEHSERLALAGRYGITLVWKIMKAFLPSLPACSLVQFRFMCDELVDIVGRKIARQTRAQDSFLSLLPTEVLRIIIGFAGENLRSKVDLALVRKSWLDIALPLLWHSINVELNHDAEVKFFARVARGTSCKTQILRNDLAGKDYPNVISVITVDRAVLAVKGLRELALAKAAVSMSVFESPTLSELTDLTLHHVVLSDSRLNHTLSLPFNLRSLSISIGSLSEDLIDKLLSAIATGTSDTLERLSLDSAKAVRKHLPSLSRNLVELSLTDVEGHPGYISGIDLKTVDLRALRKLTLPRSELHTLLALPPADAPPDAPRCTISQAIPQLEHLVVLCAGSPVYHDDLSNLDRLLRLPVCTALRSLALEDAEFDEEMLESEVEVFSNMVVICKGRGLEVKVNGERQW